MSEQQTTEAVNCGECSFRHIANGESVCWANERIFAIESGLHDCEHFSPSPAARTAEALEGIEVALMVLAGIWQSQASDAHTDFWECLCGVTLGQSRDETKAQCPNCGAEFIGDGSGKWIEAEKDPKED
jgi:DNA-directed RNA polymerase subunit RPC12/RpoP